MKKLTIPGALSAGLLMLASSFTQAALLGRDLDGNLATAEAYFDTALSITWLADANAAGTTMDWWAANAWAAGLDPYGSGITGWRLPETNPVNGVSYNYDLSFDGSTDFGWNISAPGSVYPGSTGSEMAHLYYNTLGNLGWSDTSGNGPQPGWGLSNTGPFANVQSHGYWSATEYAPDSDRAWAFFMGDGFQSYYFKADGLYAWAVHTGDVGASTVPVPAAVWLFGSGLLGLGAVARKRRR